MKSYDTQCFPDEDPVIIQFNIKRFLNCTETVAFDLLHEIGHANTGGDQYARCVREYEATAWAIEHAKEYGVVIPESRKKELQDDIFFWKRIEKATQVKFGFEKKKFYPDEKLTLNWERMEPPAKK